jgi:hypothetical protein
MVSTNRTFVKISPDRREIGELKFEYKPSYGRDLFFPICSDSKIFSALGRRDKNFTFKDLMMMKQLGYGLQIARISEEKAMELDHGDWNK